MVTVQSDAEGTTIESPPIRAFLCHSSGDKAVVRDLYLRLKADGFLPWLDEENLIAGQDWEREIRKAVRQSDTVIVCLSRNSINKTGFIQKELKYALDVADEQPEGSIFIIPLRLEPCDVPERLAKWHWINYFEDNAHERLVQALRSKIMAGRSQVATDIRVPPKAKGSPPPNLVYTSPQEVTSTSKHRWPPPNWEKLALLIFAVWFLLTLIVLAIKFHDPTPFQLTVFRVILSLAAAGIAAFIPGLIEFEIKPALRTGGALAVFAIVYFTNPGQLVLQQQLTTSDRIAYAGTVKDANTLKPVGNALVGITEDQSLPERFTTDSEGVFFAKVSKDTQTMLLEITAAGYQDYSRRGPTVRPGSEDIFLQPPAAPSVPSPDKETTEILSDYETRLHDLDRLVKQADNSTDIDTKGANSILVYRIAYGAAEYRTSLPEFQNVPWATLIRKLEKAGVPDSTADAIKATDTLMNGPYVGKDSIKRGYFGPGILDAQENTLQAYYDAAHKHFFGR
jgi:TIR domain